MNKTQTYVLLVEDNPADVFFVRDALGRDSLTTSDVTVVERLGAALALLKSRPFDVILLDLGLPDSQGLETFTRLHQAHPDTPIIVLSGLLDEVVALQAVQTGAQDYLVKGPVGWDLIARAIRYAIERQKAQRELRESEDKYRLMFETMVQGVVFQDAGGQVIHANPAAEKILGLTLDQLQGRTSSDPRWRAVHEDGSDFSGEAHPAMLALRTGRPVHDVTMGVYNPELDAYRWLNVNATPRVHPGDAKPYQVYTTFEDVTAQKQAEQVLKEKLRLQEQIEKTASTVPGLIHTFKQDADGKYSFPYASPAIEDVYGLKPEDVAEDAAPVFALMDRQDVPHLQATIEASARAMMPWRDEFRLHHPRKGLRWFEGHSTPIREADGSILWHGFIQDITERKQAEQALAESEDLYRTLVNTLDVSLCRWLPDTTLVYTNEKYRRIFGIQDETARQPWLNFLPAETREVTAATYRELAAHPHVLSYEHPVIVEDGSVRHYQWIDTPIVDADGRVREFQSVGIDITERKRMEDLVSAQRDLARIVSTVASSQAAWPLCFEIALRVSGMDCGGIYLFDPDHRVLELVYHQGLGADFVREVARYPADAPNAQALQAGKSAYFNADELRQASLPDYEALQSLAVVPIHYQGRVLGGMNMASHTLPEVSEAARTALETVAPEIGNLIVYLRTESLLRASEEKYRGLMQSLDSVVSTVDYDGRFLYMNDMAARQLGGAVQELTGKTMHELFPAPIASRQLEHLRRVIRDDRSIVSEVQSIVQGQPRWYRTMIQPIHDETGRVIYALVNSTDIHDLKTAQQALLELNRTLEERVEARAAEVQDLYDNAPTGYQSLDENGAFVLVNQTELNWLGYTREEIVGVKTFPDLLTPRSQQVFAESFPRFKVRGWIKDVEFDLIRKDGSILPVLVNATAIYDAEGGYLQSRSTLLDITERRKAEAALRESEAQNRLLFEEAPDAVILFDAAGRVVRMNRAFEVITGLAREQIAGHSLDELGLLAREHLERLAAAVVEALQFSDRFAVAEFQLNRADGEICDVAARVFGVKIHDRQHYLATMHDITAEKQAEETMRRANAELAKAIRTKDEFLANMSHELRTPLSAILLLSEGLLAQLRGPLNERQQSALRNIETSGRHLLALINDILDLSKVEAGRLDLQFEIVPIAEVCEASMSFIKEMAVKKSLRLAFQLNDHPATVEADPKRLKQMLVNLLSNAVKFTPVGGQVGLEVTVVPEVGAVRFAVQDNGIGISAEGLARLFQPFTQLDSSLSRQSEGSGLGLALVRRLAELHGGSVAVESTVGQGSRFTITLPYRPPAPAQAKSAAAPAAERRTGLLSTALAVEETERAAGGRILLAEDNEINIQAIGDYLQGRGYHVVVAHNGQEALDLAGAMRPDLILMDIQMPKMDGLEATRHLRARPEYAVTPIIALTALAMPGDRERCLAAGANEYLTKPISLQGLVATIQRLLNK